MRKTRKTPKRTTTERQDRAANEAERTEAARKGYAVDLSAHDAKALTGALGHSSRKAAEARRDGVAS